MVEEAEALASRLPAYAGADPAHVDVFARVNASMWDEIEREQPARWITAMAAAARAWADSRT